VQLGCNYCRAGSSPGYAAISGMPRAYGSGRLYIKSGSYYGRWRTPDGRYLNRRVGKARRRGEKDGLTKAEAERGLRRLIEKENLRPRPPGHQPLPTVDDAVDQFRERLAIQGARLSYLQNCESMQRIHISPAVGGRRIDSVTRQDVERLGHAMLSRGLAPKTVRNVMTFLHSVFELAIANGWIERNPVAGAARPKRRRQGDANPDRQFLTGRAARVGARGHPGRADAPCAAGDAAGTSRPRTAPARRRPRAGPSRADPRGRRHWSAAIGAHRSALA
jgi:hypothetical protein